MKETLHTGSLCCVPEKDWGHNTVVGVSTRETRVETLYSSLVPADGRDGSRGNRTKEEVSTRENYDGPLIGHPFFLQTPDIDDPSRFYDSLRKGP